MNKVCGNQNPATSGQANGRKRSEKGDKSQGQKRKVDAWFMDSCRHGWCYISSMAVLQKIFKITRNISVLESFLFYVII